MLSNHRQQCTSATRVGTSWRHFEQFREYATSGIGLQDDDGSSGMNRFTELLAQKVAKAHSLYVGHKYGIRFPWTTDGYSEQVRTANNSTYWGRYSLLLE
jgi:hypothetical protein